MSEIETLRAAIERVRAIHKVKHGEKPVWALGGIQGVHKPTRFEKYSMCEGCSATWPCRTIEAFDGAPEPEWEYAASKGDPGPHHLTRFSTDLGTLARRNENRERMGHGPLQVYRRRKAGPWLPVEGESKP